MERYLDFYRKYRANIDVLFLYTLEAHFVEEKINEDGSTELEGWPIGTQFRYPQHKTLDERIQMAKEFFSVQLEDSSFPIAVDSISNDFNNTYCSWPDRAYVFFNGRLMYKSYVNMGGSRDTVFTDQIKELLRLP